MASKKLGIQTKAIKPLDMSNKIELAPMANTAETTLLDENSKENLEGIDDGLTTNNEKPSPEEDLKPRIRPTHTPSHPPAGYPYTPIPVPSGRRPLDVNLYATKKTVAQGMMDLALLTANANQLRYVLESSNIGPYYYFSVVLISLSIILQLVIGVGLIFLGRYNVSHIEHVHKAERLNNWVVLGVFLITSINVFISAFGIEPVEKVDPALIVDATLDLMRKESDVEFTTPT